MCCVGGGSDGGGGCVPGGLGVGVGSGCSVGGGGGCGVGVSVGVGGIVVGGVGGGDAGAGSLGPYHAFAEKPPLQLLGDAQVVEVLWSGKQSMMRRLLRRLEAVYSEKFIVEIVEYEPVEETVKEREVGEPAKRGKEPRVRNVSLFFYGARGIFLAWHLIIFMVCCLFGLDRDSPFFCPAAFFPGLSFSPAHFALLAVLVLLIFSVQLFSGRVFFRKKNAGHSDLSFLASSSLPIPSPRPSLPPSLSPLPRGT